MQIFSGRNATAERQGSGAGLGISQAALDRGQYVSYLLIVLLEPPMSVFESVKRVVASILFARFPLTNSIPDGILAFRSITTLLGIIQQKPYDSCCVDEHPKVLWISVAFSTLAALGHEVVAVAAKQKSEGIEIIVCSDGNDQITSKGPPLVVCCFMLVKNYFWTKLCKKECLHINPTQPPSELTDSENLKGLKTYVERLWNSPTEKAPHLHSPLPTHLDILGKLLCVKAEPVEVAILFMHYIISTSYKVSSAYLESLRGMSLTSLAKLDFEVEVLTESDTAKDRAFLNLWMGYFNANLRQGLPGLDLLADQAQTRKGITPWLYSKETRQEFHQLLLLLLQNFEESLRMLDKIRNSPPVSDSSNFPLYLQNVMRNINTPASICTNDRGPKEEHNVYDKEDVDCQEVVEPLVTKKRNLSPLLKPYRDWLQLIVAKFDAAEVLIQYFVGLHQQRIPISIQVLDAPIVDKKLLPWVTVLPETAAKSGITNAEILQFFEDAMSVGPDDSLSFVMKMKCIWETKNCPVLYDLIQEQLKLFKRRWFDWRRMFNLKTQKLYLMPGWSMHLLELSVKLVQLQTAPLEKADINKLGPSNSSKSIGTIEAKITNILETLGKSALFFKTFQTKMSTGNFEGKIHCETYLASFLAHNGIEDSMVDASFDKVLKETKDYGDVIGVSKRSCPTCHHLMGALHYKNGPFHTRGSHSTVSTCSLPTWLASPLKPTAETHCNAPIASWREWYTRSTRVTEQEV
ncbi:hypothetical protein CPB84DRAFT_1930794 [Gymnopilus junonius]|uniref:Uncharacterized protein n=1 Tax=Gymnopilus junonius TaxID=109634 RepID=A0A9P5NNA2_GYMJU|nr:hypothetical protein CPB84DRAFT_1930794 [Gymnopilus junonius]